MSSSSPVTTTRRPAVVTVIPPHEHGPAKWFETNPVLTVAIAVAIVVLVMGCIFCWIRKRRKNKVDAAATVDQNQNNNASAGEPRPSQDFIIAPITPQIRNSFSTTSASGAPRPSMISEDLLNGESFIIIENSPANTNPRQDPKRYKKRKSLAMPPGFYVSSRRKSTASSVPENELRPPRISFARWSTAGLEIHTADMKTNKVRTMSVPCTDHKKLSVPEISTTTTTTTGSNFLTPSQAAMVLRRVSQGHNHTIYATEPRPSLSPRGNSDSMENDQTKMSIAAENPFQEFMMPSKIFPTRSGGVTVIPGEENAIGNWFQKNSALAVSISVAIVVLILACIFFWIRKKRKESNTPSTLTNGESIMNQTNKKSIQLENPEGEVVTSTSAHSRLSSASSMAKTSVHSLPVINPEDLLDGSFIIVENSPESNAEILHRQEAKKYLKTKRKSLAMPSGLNVGSRRKSIHSIAPENGRRPSRVRFEIHIKNNER